jgi:hypothetical protein
VILGILLLLSDGYRVAATHDGTSMRRDEEATSA